MPDKKIIKRILLWGSLLFALMGFAATVHAQTAATPPTPLPFSINFGVQGTEDPKTISKAVEFVIFITVITLAPSIMVMVTSFTRIVIVLNFLKRAAGVGSQPSDQIIAGLALFITFYVMAPVGMEINEKAIKPYLNESISQQEAIDNLLKPLRGFMFKYTREKDISLFAKIAKMNNIRTRDDVPTYILIPAYIISELKTAFQVGFVLFLPFLIIDMVIASILMSMGMIVLPPITISTPFKILLFVMVDGWHLIIRSITMGFGA